jgi:serine/threonine-protein kinase
MSRLPLAVTLALLGASTAATADPAQVVVPDLAGLTQAQAEAAIKKAGLFPDVGDASGDSHDDAALENCFNGTHVGTVCAQAMKPGTHADRDARLTAMIGEAADGKVLVMPDLTGLTLDQAQAKLKQVGFFSPRPASNYSDACKPHVICAQHFPAGMKVRWNIGQLVDVGQ